ncbi:MAG: hypothetical protein EU541_01975 [Promethearchaeota archaeon]|nr:MAG: hypothetical protein EU541_01975 [Candidatus Lokiarchaeota archaeon]
MKDYYDKKKRLLESLTAKNLLQDKRLYQAFMEVPLEEFIPRKYIDTVKLYKDIPNLFYYQDPQNYRTISAPHMITIMLQGLALKKDDDLLILGAKSGYISALAHKLAPKGEIIILEANSEIATITRENLEKLDLDKNVSVIVKNPLEGMPDLSPWQKILVTGAIRQNRIHPLLKQLDPNEGVLYAPIGEELVQTYTQILRVDGNFYGKRQLKVRFTPLMTRVELDNIQLAADVEESGKPIEIKHNPEKVDEALEDIKVKYASNIIDEIDMEEQPKTKELELKLREEAIQFLRELLDHARCFKTEDEISTCFDLIEYMDGEIESLKTFKKDLGLKVKKIKSIVNNIRSYNILRKDLDKSDNMEKKHEIINKQMNEINTLEELIHSEIERLQ